MTRPHEFPHLTVMADHLPCEDTYSKTADASPHLIQTLNVCDLFAEVDPRAGQEWSASIYRRLLAASTGPVAVGVREAPIRDRMESAGWFVAAEDGNFAEARSHCWPALQKVRRLSLGIGSPRPQLVLVGDRCTRFGQLPFASKSGTWLFLALRALGYDELSIYLTNARRVRGGRQGKQLAELRDAFAASGMGPTWVGMGNTASEVLETNGIAHKKVVHPTYHKRYKHSEDVTGYAKRMRDAGVPEGEWLGRDMWKHTVASIPHLAKPYEIRDLSHRGDLPAEAIAGVKAKTVDPVKREVARRAFVTGEAKTLQEASKLAKLHIDQTRSIAKAEHWKAERDEHQRRVTEQVKQRSERTIARDIAKSLSLAWKATALGLTDVVERLEAGRGVKEAVDALEARMIAGDPGAVPLHPKPQGVEALARVAMNLHGADVADDPQSERIRSLPLKALAEETLKCMKDQFGL